MTFGGVRLLEAGIFDRVFKGPASGLYAPDLLEEASKSLARAETHVARALGKAEAPAVRMLLKNVQQHLQLAADSAQFASEDVVANGLGAKKREAAMLGGAVALLAGLGCSARDAVPAKAKG
eukprot:CAMPEP_0171072808 /NCGR_PEP_ID=MMETSP0766_2-20121228/11106_1 /TAXON_ID=439317 /ORGANISM="Gambierdiscus australes, Strain CAWD 149" /LENGTH=121 /DNA_ID=CAMNT_0011529433 /DNA_START=109 /DNA_END=470 /DNA_ORIENTATION=-